NCPIWSEQSSGIAQFAVWVAFAEAGIGASLQHYNPVVGEAVASTWNIPASWKLRAQMPFGSNEAGFGEKSFMDDAERFLIFAGGGQGDPGVPPGRDACSILQCMPDSHPGGSRR